MMNPVQFFEFGKSRGFAPNVFIGGVASVINTPALLAVNFLNHPSDTTFSASNIKNFTIIGNDIQCYIGVDYKIGYNIFWGNSLITYFKDLGRCKSFGVNSFRECPNLQYIDCLGAGPFLGSYVAHGSANCTLINLPNATSLPNNFFYDDATPNPKTFYIPRATILGIATGYDSCMYLIPSNSKIYANPFLQTSNAGAEEGDIAYARNTRGATIRYVTNFTPPNQINNLSIGNVYSTALQINFTAPTGSTNAIESYDCYANGFYKNTITASGQYITGLTPNTSYNIELKPVDIFYNKSTSNIVTQTTSASYGTDADANAYISVAGLFGAEEESAYKLITDLKANSLWNKIQAIYPFKGTTAGQHKFNAKNPLDTNNAFRLVFSGGGTHSDLGYQCNGTNSYADTNFNARTYLSPTNCGTTVVSGTNNATASTDVQEIGCQSSGADIIRQSVKANNTNFTRQAFISNHSVNTNGVNDARGIFTQSKTSNSLLKSYRNAAILGQVTTTVTGTVPNKNIWIGVCNGNGRYSNQRIQMVIIHEGLSDAEVITLHSIIDISESIAGRKTW